MPGRGGRVLSMDRARRCEAAAKLPLGSAGRPPLFQIAGAFGGTPDSFGKSQGARPPAPDHPASPPRQAVPPCGAPVCCTWATCPRASASLSCTTCSTRCGRTPMPRRHSLRRHGHRSEYVRSRRLLSASPQFGPIRGIDIKLPPRPPPFAFVEFEDPRCGIGPEQQQPAWRCKRDAALPRHGDGAAAHEPMRPAWAAAAELGAAHARRGCACPWGPAPPALAKQTCCATPPNPCPRACRDAEEAARRQEEEMSKPLSAAEYNALLASSSGMCLCLMM